MVVSLCIVALNESKYLSILFESLLKQDYDKSDVELIFSVAPSRDNTLEQIENFKKEYNDIFFDIKILTNDRIRQAPGLNLAIRNSVGDLIIRVDSHSELTSNFISENVKTIMSGEDVCGGMQESALLNTSKRSEMLLLVETSSFGSGIAEFRNKQYEEKQYVSTVANGCYKREVFEKIGLFNTELLRSEDNELCYRIRDNGYKICLNSDIKNKYYVRSSLKGSLKQKYGNGKWIGITSVNLTPKIFSLYHFIPFVFLIGLIGCLCLPLLSFAIDISLIYFFVPLMAFFSLYIIFLLLNIIGIIKKSKNFLMIFSPIIYFLIHLSYGYGTLVGLITAFKYKKKIRAGKEEL